MCVDYVTARLTWPSELTVQVLAPASLHGAVVSSPNWCMMCVSVPVIMHGLMTHEVGGLPDKIAQVLAGWG